MSLFSSPGPSELEAVPSWFSVICGQGEYDVRAMSHADAGNRVQSYIKHAGLDMGFPLTAEFAPGDVLFREIMWRRTGGDEAHPDEAEPILRNYIEPQPYARRKRAVELPHHPQLFTYEHRSFPMERDHDLKHMPTTHLDARHELTILSTWQGELEVSLRGLRAAVEIQ